MTTEFEYQNVPIGKFNVTSKADKLTGEIELVTRNAERMERELIETKSAHVKDRLYELGWIGPCNAVIVKLKHYGEGDALRPVISIACKDKDMLPYLKDLAQRMHREYA